jgi:ABC-type transporter Mla maintaining outer membrane lipid asymmetry permease subunit MlaE
VQVSEQTDSLRVLGSDPVDYLITPRVLACMIAGPILNLLCFCMGAPPSGSGSAWATGTALLRKPLR